MTEEEIKTLKPGDMVVWDITTSEGRIECYMSYDCVVPGASPYYKFTTMLDLSNGKYAAYEPGTAEILEPGTVLNECRLLREDAR